MKIAVYPGSFDPVTIGHISVIKRASNLFDLLIVGILNNPSKNFMFSQAERMSMLNLSIKSFINTTVKVFSGLTLDFCKEQNANYIVRGIRQNMDASFELEMAYVNKKLNPKLETVFLPSIESEYLVSSSLVKELALFGADISELVPNKEVKKCIIEKIRGIKVGEK